MNRKDIIKKLVSEGMSEKTLSSFSDKQINYLAERMLGEATQVVMTKFDKNKPQDVAMMNTMLKDPVKNAEALKKSTFGEEIKETLKGNQKKLDKNHNGKIDGQDFKILKGQNKKSVEEKEKPSSGLSAKKKSEVVKKAKSGGDIGKKGKGFKEVEKKAKESGAENPKAVASSAMWKNVKRESVLNENKNKIEVILKLNDSSLKKFKTIPTFKDMLYDSQLKNLKVGENNLTVNHTVWGKLQRMEGPGGYSVKKSVKENKEITNWLSSLVESEYHPFTSKGEIVDLIKQKINK